MGAVHRIIREGMYTGWDDKTLSRSGDMAAIAILKSVSEEEFTSPEILKGELNILHISFECPSNCITACSDRQPRVTMLILERLHNTTSGQTRSEVDKLREYILQQTQENDPEKVLFDRAMLAVTQKRFDVAHLIFQTLINTYPNSKYTRRAEKVMRDPQIGGCGPAWPTPPCIDYSHGVPR
jgi:hypothetical protein